MKDIYVSDLSTFEESKIFDAFFLVFTSSSEQPRPTSHT